MKKNKIESIRTECTGCMLCENICPKDCVSMVEDKCGFKYPLIDYTECINCGLCEKKCPVLQKREESEFVNARYGWNSNSNVRANSSSGGVFAGFAEKYIEQGGIVYGAAFSDNYTTVKHTSTKKVPLSELMKSKYVESDHGNIFAEVKADVESGKKVLFCSTPCQCAGLVHYLGKDYNNLLIIDFICHGVPSRKIYKDYIEMLEKKLGGKLKYLSFRDKDCGWRGDFMHLKAKAKKDYTKYWVFDEYFAGFQKNAFLRRSCYNCEFIKRHYSDITIADFWGYAEYNPEINDEKGISLILTNTDKGEKILLENKENFEIFSLERKYAEYVYKRKDNSSKIVLREKFFELYEKYGLKRTARKLYLKNYHLLYVKYNIKKIVKKILKYSVKNGSR